MTTGWWFQPKNISQNGNLPQVGLKIKNLWNHHLEEFSSRDTDISPKPFVLGISLASRRALKMGVKGCGHLDSLVTSMATRLLQLTQFISWLVRSDSMLLQHSFQKTSGTFKMVGWCFFVLNSFWLLGSVKIKNTSKPPESTEWLGCGKTIVLAHLSRPQRWLAAPLQRWRNPRPPSLGVLTAHGSGNEALGKGREGSMTW